MDGIFRKEADVQWSRIRLGGLLAVAVAAVTLTHEPLHAEEQIAEVRSLSHELAVLESEEMVYSASKRLEAVNTAPMAVSVMTADRIEAIPARYLPQILRLLPGVDVLQITRTEFTVGIRGFANQGNFRPRDVLVLVDGRTIYDDFSGNIEWEILDIFPQDVAKIEVIRGGGSAIHGANAARGVINFITKPPEAVSRFEADTTVATRNGFRQRVATSATSGPFAWTLSGGFDHADLWDRFENLSLSDDRGDRTWRVHTVGERRLDAMAVLRLDAGLNHGKIIQHNTSGFLVDNHKTMNHVQLEYEHPSLSVRSFWNARDVKKFSIRTGSLASQKTENLYDLETVYRIRDLGRHSLSLGGGARYTSVRSLDLLGEVGQFTAGVFADEQFNATDRFLVRIAGRLDYHQETYYQFSPRAGVTYQLHPEHFIKGSVSVGYRTPTISNNFFNFQAGPDRIVGNRELKPEESIWYEIGYLWQSARDFTAGLDTYYVTSKNLIESTDPPLISFVNASEKITGGGGEIWTEYRLRPSVRLIANYAHARFRQGSQEIDLTSPHKVNAGVLFTALPRITGAVTCHLVARTTSPVAIAGTGIGGEMVDSYVVVNAFVGYRLTDAASVRIETFNLANDIHREISLGEEIPFELNATLQITL
jgi:iron complex outermembrane receptor protein